MERRFILMLIVVMLAFAVSHAKTLFPDSETAKNDVELGVEGISRLCPTGLWDHWIFRDIMYDRESNAVVFVIQLHRWNERRDDKEFTEDEALKEAEWIVGNIMKGYNALKESPRIMLDGDFMLYLSLGTLLNQMEKDGASLRIVLLKPDYVNIVSKNTPMMLSPEELKPMIHE